MQLSTLNHINIKNISIFSPPNTCNALGFSLNWCRHFVFLVKTVSSSSVSFTSSILHTYDIPLFLVIHFQPVIIICTELFYYQRDSKNERKFVSDFTQYSAVNCNVSRRRTIFLIIFSSCFKQNYVLLF